MMRFQQNRREFIQQMGGGALSLAAVSSLGACTTPESPNTDDMVSYPAQLRMYIGTYTNGASEGIYTAYFDPGTGAITDIKLASGAENPSFLTVSSDRSLLLAVNELMDYEGSPAGSVTSYAIEPDGLLQKIDQRSTQGAHPCYISLTSSDRWALVANYTGGNVIVFPVGEVGHLGPATSLIQHEGSSVNPARQDAPHPHFIAPDPTGEYIIVVDLGIDKTLIYAMDQETGVLTPHSPASVPVEPGAGPRHFAFHPNAEYAFGINELNSTITAYRYGASPGGLVPVQTISTLPNTFDGDSYCADIHVHPNGRFIYGSNRGHDSIVILSFDPSSGTMSVSGHESTQGQTPRNFTLDPSGLYVLVANQRSDTIVSFNIDQETGILTPTGHIAEVPTPVCLKFA